MGIKLSPANTYYGMGDGNPKALLAFACKRLSDIGIAYSHLMEPAAGSENSAPMRDVARSLRPFIGTKLLDQDRLRLNQSEP